jgi:hypothetical protein
VRETNFYGMEFSTWGIMLTLRKFQIFEAFHFGDFWIRKKALEMLNLYMSGVMQVITFYN